MAAGEGVDVYWLPYCHSHTIFQIFVCSEGKGFHAEDAE